MDNSTAQPPNKKLFYAAIAVVAVTILFILITVFTTFSNKQNSAQNQTQNTSNGSSVQTQPNQNSNSNPNQSAGTNIYKNTLFSLSYPNDWKTQETKLQQGGIAVKLTPVRNKIYASMIVTADSISAIPSIKDQQKAFLSLGFVQDTTLVDTLAANRIRGTLSSSSETASTSANAGALQLTHIYFDKGNYSYLFDYSYLGKGTNPEVENTFNQIIASFKLVQ